MIPTAIPNLSGNESRYLQECVSTNFVSSVGPFVSRFEEHIAAASGAPHAVTLSSGTTALHMALLAAGVQPDDLVIIPSFSFIATANSVSHCSATAWLMDIEAQSWTLDPRQLEIELKSNLTLKGGRAYHRGSGRRVGALMPVHVLGNAADMTALVEIATQYEIPVVADGAAALGATYKGARIHYPGVLTAFSFNGNKTITSGGGGAVVGDEAKIALIRHISSTARVGSTYNHDRIGYNFRMTNVQAAVGCAQIEQLDKFVSRKRAIDRHYRQTLPELEAFPRPVWGESACWYSGIVVDSQSTVEELSRRLLSRGVEGKAFWKPIHLQLPYSKAPRAVLSRTEAMWNRILTLPCSTSITDAELNQVSESVLAALTAKNYESIFYSLK